MRLLVSASVMALVGAASPALAADDSVVEELVVLGRGEARQVQTVRGEELLTRVPGASALKLVDQLPGVFFSSSDPFGNYEYSASLSIRGFNQTQLGYTLDGVPLGDMSYSNHNGLHISRAIISEGVDRVQLAQGASDVDAASTSNLGGTLKYVSRAPEADFGVELGLSAGQDAMRRLMVRLDSGEIAGIGGRASFTFADSVTDKWKGPGEQKLRQVNIKYARDIGAGTLTAWLNGSQRRENDYLEQSKEQIARLGYNWDYLAPNYALAVQLADIAHNNGDSGLPPTNPAAGTDYPAPFASPDDAYFLGAGLRDDVIGAVTWSSPLGDRLRTTATLYGHADRGQGPWFTPYVQSPNALDPTATTDNAPLAFRGFHYRFARYGVLADVEGTFGAHTVKIGGWIEENSSSEGYRYYGLDRARPSRDSLKFQSGAFLVSNHYHFDTETIKIYASDSWKLTDALTVNFGFKGQTVESKSETRTLDNLVPVAGDPANIRAKIDATDWFMPQAGFNWRLGGRHEVFGSYGESQGAFAAQADGVIANGTQAIVDDAVARLKPETSKTFELGWRWRNERLQAVLAAYHVDFDNRLLAFTADPTSPILQSDSIYRNVGSVRSVGLEAVLRAEFTRSLNAGISFTYNESKYRQDVLDDQGLVAMNTRDKQVAGSPKVLVKGDITYDDGSLFGGLNYSFTDKQFYTYENDASVDSYSLVDLNLGYRFTGEGWLGGTEISLNVANLLDERYIAAFVGYQPNDPAGTAQVLLTGAPRSTFVSLRRKF